MGGEIEQLFSDFNISFNNFTADFDVNNQVVGSVTLQNNSSDEIRYIWTKNALNKIGYNLNSQSNMRINIDDKNVSVTYISAGQFKLKLVVEDFKQGKKRMAEILEGLEEKAKKHKCEFYATEDK